MGCCFLPENIVEIEAIVTEYFGVFLFCERFIEGLRLSWDRLDCLGFLISEPRRLILELV